MARLPRLMRLWAWLLLTIGYLYAASGKRDEALKVVDQLKDLSERRHIAAYSFAMIYAALGEKDKALENLEKDFGVREPSFKYAGVDPFLVNLHSDQRFA